MTSTIDHSRLNAASARMTTAKATFTAAAKAAMAGNPEAEHRAKAALAELNAAHSDLKRLRGAPPPQDVWAESARLMSDRP